MKTSAMILALGLALSGCGLGQPSDKTVLARVNNYEITVGEFEQEFKASPYAASDTPQARREFLDSLITRKLILQEAQARGLDKAKAFLKMIERFWEQSLFKLYVDQKSREIAKSVAIDDKAVLDAYKKMAQEGRADRPDQEMYVLIRQDLAKRREAILTDDWLKSLRKDANIKINDGLLNSRR